MEDFSCEHLLSFDGPHNDEREVPYVPIDHDDISPLGLYRCGIIPMLNLCRERYLETKDKDIWWQMIQLLPSSYNQTRSIMLNYEVLANIYRQMKNHKLDEWREFCEWIETLPYSELIIGAAGSIEARGMFGEPFPWTKEADERLKAETEGIIKAVFDKELHDAIIPDSNKSSFSMKDLEEAMKHFDPNNGVKTHVTMMKED